MNTNAEQPGFLPDDYVKARAERRTNIFAVSLCVVVLAGVALAYVATDRTWTDVRTARASVAQRFDEARDRIQEMNAYKQRIEEIVDKARIAVGILDPVPKSILVATLVDRMPDRLSLTDLDLRTVELKAPPRKPDAVATLSSRGHGSSASKAEEASPRPESRKWATTVELEGLAPSNREVSLYIDALASVELLRRVRLDHTRVVDVDDREMVAFRVLFELEPEADVRRIDASRIATVDLEDE